MRYEVVEDAGEWIVRREGTELARFADQDSALQDVAGRMRGADASTPASLAVRYERKAG